MKEEGGIIVDAKGIKLNISLDNNQIILLSVFIFFAFFLASLIAGLILNSIFSK